MYNIKAIIENNVLRLAIDLSEPGVPSKSGKSVLLASTEGNHTLPNTNGIKLGLNLYRSK